MIRQQKLPKQLIMTTSSLQEAAVKLGYLTAEQFAELCETRGNDSAKSRMYD